MTRTPLPARRLTSAKSHRVHRTIARRIRPSPRRSSNIFHTRRDSRDSFNFSDNEHENEPNYDQPASPVKKPRVSYNWEDEPTLVSSLLQDAPGGDPADPNLKLTALVDSLQDPFTRAGTALLQDMAHTLQPAVQSVTVAHRALDRRVDHGFATGIIAFDDACKGFEALNIDEERTLQSAFTATETRIKDLFARLEDAYAHRDRLWTDLEGVLVNTVDPAIAALAEIPATTERTIATLEKHAKSLAAKDDDGADKLRGVLAKFT
ncbi:hypothetical protein C8F04DRAFT_1248114 [Mycena alexandri]|uniref:Uncharacterized protein n=1 Tax=Mycena alexandri TaxID=1745969 RepID=A0AAD6TNI9_9AGAR|nr:hypothetical protein C8F04DRAFT_1248114 [Mycena alexandri]